VTGNSGSDQCLTNGLESRGAATDCSHGRKPVEIVCSGIQLYLSPTRKRGATICRRSAAPGSICQAWSDPDPLWPTSDRGNYMRALSSTHILGKLLEAKQERLEKARMRVPEPIVRRMAMTAPAVPSFRAALEGPQRVRIIAEVKKASPSRGVLCTNLNVAQLVATYKTAGAAAISAVTEEDFFQGDLGWVATIRDTTTLPVLRKDFVFDPFQVYETRGAGASAILLIVAMLRPDELKSLITLSHEVGLDVLVEVHDETELVDALEAGLSIIGVNNRDLKTFQVDLETSIRLSKLIPDDRLFVAESGIHSRNDIERLLDAGADAFLIGEHFITSADPAAELRGLL
jgi:indole-3-glycerol phosphate synthase